ncbi:hypothetical protein EYF80_042519 [Liparis tanakae]|uniref:Uncharacterized protein n=1 Tax=Liparis tanakae TaxID=230148 RepID=A0A4Z2G215_9TELE|nr:hypothetical protein EYF80_042519 [Liparis tanakae]
MTAEVRRWGTAEACSLVLPPRRAPERGSIRPGPPVNASPAQQLRPEHPSAAAADRPASVGTAQRGVREKAVIQRGRASINYSAETSDPGVYLWQTPV